MEKNFCKTCGYYRQHYTLNKRRIFRVHCGHCTLSKVKRRTPDIEACDSYVPAQPDECAFASKEYLSKELLQYLMNLELLPEIMDEESAEKEKEPVE